MAMPRRLPSAAVLASLLSLGAARPAAAGAPDAPVAPVAPVSSVQRIGLREAIELALRTDPGLLGAVATRRRGDNALLRAQLDRFSLKVDASLTEQFTASNIGGPRGADSCYGAVPL